MFVNKSYDENLTKQITMSVQEVADYLRCNKINDRIIQIFLHHEIDVSILPLMKESDLAEMNVKTIGMRKKLMQIIKKYPYDSNSHFIFNEEKYNCDKTSSDSWSKHVSDNERMTKNVSHVLEQCNNDPWKLIISFLYVFIVFGITAFVMVIAHERLPDISKYPPLPDLILDNVPYISWAFDASEMVAISLMVIWLIILMFHKYRFILCGRFFNLLGTVFLLRSVTMIITSLSVPGTHLHSTCEQFNKNLTFDQKIYRAMDIWVGFGMSLKGVRSCGDYMFSGHTTILTLLNFFVTEYTPRRFYHLHTLAWILNLFGIFFILAAHEHYSIDVFIAFYISSRLFLYYHWQANNYSLMTRDQSRARIWFPMFTWFESNCPGTIPNIYEIPFLFSFNRLKIKINRKLKI